MGEFSPPLFLSPLLSFLFLIPQMLIGSNTLLQKFTPHFKILDPRLRVQLFRPGLNLSLRENASVVRCLRVKTLQLD